MATTAKLKLEIKKLKAAIKSKATPKTIVTKLKSQLEKKESELHSKGKKGVTSSKSKAFATAQSTRRKQGGVSSSKSDIEKDAERPAKPIGLRVTDGKHYPYVKGNKYYEYRENRTDRKQPPKKYPKLEHGGMMAKGGILYKYTPDDVYKYAVESKYIIGFQGREDILYFKSEQEAKDYVKEKPSSREYLGIKMADGGMMAKGGSIEEGNVEMIMSNVKSIKHHAEEIENILSKGVEVEAWVNAKAERAATDLSDITHYLDGLKMAYGGVVHGHHEHHVHTHSHEHRIKH
jgi:hypothetical protein